VTAAIGLACAVLGFIGGWAACIHVDVTASLRRAAALAPPEDDADPGTRPFPVPTEAELELWAAGFERKHR
jgi:hypothetical protein